MAKRRYGRFGKPHTAFRDKWIRIRQVRFTNQMSTATYDYISGYSSVNIVALTEDMQVVLLSEYRVPVRQLNTEIPGGRLETERPLSGAKRELQEETGILAHHWHHLATIHPFTPRSDESKHIFLAQELDLSSQRPQLEEDIQKILFVPLKEALVQIRKGRITDASTIACLTIAALHLGLLPD